MKKLALILLLIAPLAAQERELRGKVPDDATVEGGCAGEKLLRLEADGLVPMSCLPTAKVELLWGVQDPAIAATVGDPVWLPSKQAGRVASVTCATDTGTVNLNFDSRDNATLGTPGTDLHTSEIVATSSSVTVSTFAGDDENAANQAWRLSISAVSGAPTRLTCSMTVERL